jgi:hypothetical protein
MQLIAAMHCGRFFAVLSPLAWAQACCRTWLTPRRSRCRKISARRSTILRMKLKPWPAGRRVGPFVTPGAIIIGGGAVGSAGGTAAVATVDGDGGDH